MKSKIKDDQIIVTISFQLLDYCHNARSFSRILIPLSFSSSEEEKQYFSVSFWNMTYSDWEEETFQWFPNYETQLSHVFIKIYNTLRFLYFHYKDWLNVSNEVFQRLTNERIAQRPTGYFTALHRRNRFLSLSFLIVFHWW